MNVPYLIKNTQDDLDEMMSNEHNYFVRAFSHLQIFNDFKLFNNLV